jgi:hypothetical protein
VRGSPHPLEPFRAHPYACRYKRQISGNCRARGICDLGEADAGVEAEHLELSAGGQLVGRFCAQVLKTSHAHSSDDDRYVG